MPKPIAKPVVAETKPVEKRDMFGRVITNAQKRKRSGLAAGGAAGGGADGASPAGAADRLPNVRFKYHEGVTDAVRRTVRVRDLL